MMRAVIFRTSGLIDIRAFTTMGMSAKPNTNSAIGYFGTGLKYAISVLVRLGAEPIVWIGHDKYTFSKQNAEFRGVNFDQLRMRHDRFRILKPRYIDLPYTTQYGRNWKPWMAFRELESNTLDENGETHLLQDFDPDWDYGEDNTTKIFVANDEFIDAHEKRSEIFLEGGLREATPGMRVQILPGPSKFLYWRGLKVYEPHEPTIYTYNFLEHLELTEDRTLAYQFYATGMLAQQILDCEDDRIIKDVVTAKQGTWEHELDFPTYAKPSRAFRRVAYSNPSGFSDNARSYFVRHDERPVTRTVDPWAANPLPWSVEDNEIQDANGDAVFKEPSGYRGKWTLIAEALCKHLNPKEEE